VELGQRLQLVMGGVLRILSESEGTVEVWDGSDVPGAASQ